MQTDIHCGLRVSSPVKWQHCLVKWLTFTFTWQGPFAVVLIESSQAKTVVSSVTFLCNIKALRGEVREVVVRNQEYNNNLLDVFPCKCITIFYQKTTSYLNYIPHPLSHNQLLLSSLICALRLTLLLFTIYYLRCLHIICQCNMHFSFHFKHNKLMTFHVISLLYLSEYSPHIPYVLLLFVCLITIFVLLSFFMYIWGTNTKTLSLYAWILD